MPNLFMIGTLFRKTIYGFSVLLGVALLLFALFYLLPGDPVALHAGPYATADTKAAIRQELGLDRPVWVRAGLYLNDLSVVSIYQHTQAKEAKFGYSVMASWDEWVLVMKKPYFGRSLATHQLVSELIFSHLKGTLMLACAALILAAAVGTVAGGIGALYHRTWLDRIVISLSIAGISVPSFVMAIAVAVVFAYWLGDYTQLNLTGSLWELDATGQEVIVWKNLILPTIALSIQPTAGIAQLTRHAFLATLYQPYIRTAEAKGLSKSRIVAKHVFRNAFASVVTGLSNWLAAFITGAFFVEYIFSTKGIGMRLVEAVNSLDYTVVIGITLTVAAIFILLQTLTDALQFWINPRMKKT